MKIKIITGLSGNAQGFGDMDMMRKIRDVLVSLGFEADILYLNNVNELIDDLQHNTYDLAWPSLYFVSDQSDYILPTKDTPWVQDILGTHQIPFVGSNGTVMRYMLDKAVTIKALAEAGIDVPWQHIVALGDELDELDKLPMLTFPAFVKPRYGSNSYGVGEFSVVESIEQLRERIAAIHTGCQQDALVEEYLPGREFTVSVVGNGDQCNVYPIENIVNPDGIDRFAVMTSKLKADNGLDFSVPLDRKKALTNYAQQATQALGCRDHVRVDIREDRNGTLKLIELNGIPSFFKGGRSFICYQMNSSTPGLHNFVKDIVNSALTRCGH